MAIPHASPGMPVDLQREGEDLSKSHTNALVKNEAFEAIRMVIPQGHQVCNDHKVEGHLTLVCLQGSISFAMGGESHTLRAGQWLFLPGGVAHTITGIEDSLVLLTVMFR